MLSLHTVHTYLLTHVRSPAILVIKILVKLSEMSLRLMSLKGLPLIKLVTLATNEQKIYYYILYICTLKLLISKENKYKKLY